MKTPMQQLQDLLRQAPKSIYTEDLLQTIGYTFVERERELIKQSCQMAIMQWHEWDKTNYIDKYDHKIEGAEIWSEDYCKELYEEIPIPELTSSQTEISDEEIYNKAVFHDGSDYSLGQHNGFIEGAKWYREQLKKKG